MAALSELPALFTNNDMRNKVASAIIIKAQALLTGTPTDDQKTWAIEALRTPMAERDWVWAYMLAANAGSSVETILGANDTAIQNAVNAAVEAIYPSP